MKLREILFAILLGVLLVAAVDLLSGCATGRDEAIGYLLNERGELLSPAEQLDRPDSYDLSNDGYWIRSHHAVREVVNVVP